MLHCQNITYEVSGRTLLESINLDIKPGEVLTILGPNGAGKSTLLKILSGELNPTRGTVQLESIDLKSISAGLLASRRAVVPQSSHLSFAFTVLEVVMLGISIPGFKRSDRKEEEDFALRILDTLGLRDFSHCFYPTLSGGEKQRVQIARALCQLTYSSNTASQSQFILLDEATANLDIAHQNLVCQILVSQAERGLGVVLVAHDLNLAATHSDRVALMKDGKVSALGTVSDVFQSALLSQTYDYPLHVEQGPLGIPTVYVAGEIDKKHSKYHLGT